MLSAFKNFLITFVIASVIFGTVAYFATQLLENTMDDILNGQDDDLNALLTGEPVKTSPATTTPVTTPSGDNPPQNIPNGNSFNMLLVISDYQPERFNDYPPSTASLESLLAAGYDASSQHFLKDYRRVTASSVVLLRADKERREFVITPISSLMKVSTPVDDMRLGDTFGYYSTEDDPSGLGFLSKKISYMTGLNIDYYLSVNISELSDVLLSIGTVNCELPCTVYTDGSGYFTVLPSGGENGELPVGISAVMTAGNQTITSDTALPLFLLSERYEDDVWNKRTILYRLFNAYLKEISDLPETRIVDLFNNLMAASLLKTNLTGETIAKEADLIKMYYEYTAKQLNYPVKLPGVAGAELSYTIPDQTAALAAFSVYR